MQQIVDTMIMPQAFLEGIIYLILKGEWVLDDIWQWRPITILNTVYKIFAKGLSLWLEPLLQELIHNLQINFVKECSILDNIFTFWESTTLSRGFGYSFT